MSSATDPLTLKLPSFPAAQGEENAKPKRSHTFATVVFHRIQVIHVKGTKPLHASHFCVRLLPTKNTDTTWRDPSVKAKTFSSQPYTDCIDPKDCQSKGEVIREFTPKQSSVPLGPTSLEATILH